jgi:hypothetical protein
LLQPACMLDRLLCWLFRNSNWHFSSLHAEETKVSILYLSIKLGNLLHLFSLWPPERVNVSMKIYSQEDQDCYLLLDMHFVMYSNRAPELPYTKQIISLRSGITLLWEVDSLCPPFWLINNKPYFLFLKISCYLWIGIEARVLAFQQHFFSFCLLCVCVSSVSPSTHEFSLSLAISPSPSLSPYLILSFQSGWIRYSDKLIFLDVFSREDEGIMVGMVK